MLTIHEMERLYKIDIAKLKYLADNCLIEEKDSFDRKDEQRLGILCSLYDIGFRADALKRFMRFDSEENFAGEVKLLNSYRSRILSDIHTKQKMIDQVDYMIYEIKNKGGKEV